MTFEVFVNILFQSLLVAFGAIIFYFFKILVTEIANLRREVHLLNEKIAEILASYRVFELRLKMLEEKGGPNEARKN